MRPEPELVTRARFVAGLAAQGNVPLTVAFNLKPKPRSEPHCRASCRPSSRWLADSSAFVRLPPRIHADHRRCEAALIHGNSWSPTILALIGAETDGGETLKLVKGSGGVTMAAIAVQLHHCPRHTPSFGMVTGLERRILEHLVRAYPAPVAREELAAAVGADAEGGHFANQVSALRTTGVLDYPAKGHVAAAPVLFLEQARR